ncbi:flavin reductase family protein [Propylenella binzhouense]|uniref:Flavin reductase n=1 Tax=Propylenella binzhouense TaxID=2555902 RepID=A0A964WTB7_9HYPH|nr:flavin reductase family protein [Propylenella binzhouense]MYZ47675.1 flavin reductase [Propylenella binzhouense]
MARPEQACGYGTASTEESREAAAELAEASSDLFRQMMSAIPAAVTIIAAEHEGVRRGLTATAVCSVSLAPPQLLVCVNQQSSARPVISASGAFSVNFLAPHHEIVARRFAQPQLSSELRFAHGDWRTSRCGAPVLADAVAAACCEVVDETLHGTHAIYVGRVVEALASGATPLLYHARSYCNFEIAARKAAD